MAPEKALTKGFQTWLDITIPQPGSSVGWARMDPFETSNRSAEALVKAVSQIRRGRFKEENTDAIQRLRDLSSTAQLATGTVDAPELTQLGRVVREGWERFGLLAQTGNDAKRYEFPRSVVLASAAMKLRVPKYRDWMDVWRRLRRDRSADEWFSDPHGTILATYLLVRRDGYCPYDVMLAAGCPPWMHMEDLQAWAASMPTPSGFASSRLDILLNKRVDATATRSAGKMAFYRALEAIRMKFDDGATRAELRRAFLAWGVEDV